MQIRACPVSALSEKDFKAAVVFDEVRKALSEVSAENCDFIPC